jgi:hypothetical protein
MAVMTCTWPYLEQQGQSDSCAHDVNSTTALHSQPSCGGHRAELCCAAMKGV